MELQRENCRVIANKNRYIVIKMVLAMNYELECIRQQVTIRVHE